MLKIILAVLALITVLLIGDAVLHVIAAQALAIEHATVLNQSLS